MAGAYGLGREQTVCVRAMIRRGAPAAEVAERGSSNSVCFSVDSEVRELV